MVPNQNSPKLLPRIYYIIGGKKKKKKKKKKKGGNGFVGNRFAEGVNVLGVPVEMEKETKEANRREIVLPGRIRKTRTEKGTHNSVLGPNVVTRWRRDCLIRACPLSLRLRGGLFFEQPRRVGNGFDIGKCEILGDGEKKNVTELL